MPRLWARPGQQGALHRDVPLAVQRRANPGSPPADLSLSGHGRSKELRRPRPRGRDRGAGTGLCDGAVRGSGAVGKVADLLSELLPVSGATNAGTVRNRTMRVG